MRDRAMRALLTFGACAVWPWAAAGAQAGAIRGTVAVPSAGI